MTSPFIEQWQKTEREIYELLDASHDVLTEEEANSVKHYLEHNEFDLAVAVYASICLEKQVKISPVLSAKLFELGSRMGFSVKESDWLNSIAEMREGRSTEISQKQ
jgi:hypothetical protein